MGRSHWLALSVVLLTGLVACAAETPMAAPLPAANPHKLPRWRGFNLLEKFQKSSQKPFVESDFRLLNQWGFNLVRLPMDYRCWIVGDDWTKLNEAVLKEIDQAVEWGGKYGVHVMLNFHRAPGYTVANPKETRSLWTDPEAQRVCALHWSTFARRYKGIPSERLSFDLFNEPAGVEPKVYAAACKVIVDAIRAEDPDRLIISDGLQWGTNPIPELIPLNLAQATRGYTPMEISHYQASWVNGERFPKPTWPMQRASGQLAAPTKADLKPEAREPLVVEGSFPADATLRLHVTTVSQKAKLVVSADGKPVFAHLFTPGPGTGEWKEVKYVEQYKLYQNLYDRDYDAPLPAGTKRVEVAVTEGDWLTLNALSICGADGTDTVPLMASWNSRPAHLRYQMGNTGGTFQSEQQLDRQWLWDTTIKPWKELEAKGVGVLVGEFGAFNKTPHDVALRWLEDLLANWQQAGWGWCMWNFRGSFGPLDSGRADVKYEQVDGHQVDRQMLELLRRY